MCKTTDEANSKTDRLIESMDRLSAALEKAALVVPTVHVPVSVVDITTLVDRTIKRAVGSGEVDRSLRRLGSAPVITRQ